VDRSFVQLSFLTCACAGEHLPIPARRPTAILDFLLIGWGELCFVGRKELEALRLDCYDAIQTGRNDIQIRRAAAGNAMRAFLLEA
jgi:hypothetical protein